MQSDTVIGIVGAVVLVAVMIGVFAYEYNNAPEVDEGPDPDSTEGKMAKFNETYPTLVAMEDLDGDGTPNYNDTDLDGDGIANEEDDAIAVTFWHNGTAAAHTNPANANGPAASKDFFVGAGNMHVHITLTYTVDQVGGALPGQERLGMSATGMGSATDSDNDGTVELMGTDLDPGSVTLNVYQTQVNNSGEPFAAMIVVEYS